MADNKNNISFSLLEIKTDQFALFEENHIENGKIKLNTNLTFGFNADDKVFLISVKYIFEMKKRPFMTIQTSCFFTIDNIALENFKAGDKTVFPKGFVAHMAMITVGTSRGVLHTKTEGTIFNKYILPTIDVTKMIPEDLIFD